MISKLSFKGLFSERTIEYGPTWSETTTTSTKPKTKPCECGGERVETLCISTVDGKVQHKMEWICDDCSYD